MIEMGGGVLFRNDSAKKCFPTERQILPDITYLWDLKKPNSEAEFRVVVARGRGVWAMKRYLSKGTKF